MITNRFSTSLFSLLGALLLLSSCRIGKPLRMPVPVSLPVRFSDQADSSQALELASRSLFTDSYLVSLLDSALRHNPDVLIATQRIELVRAALLASKGAFLPSVNAVASAGADRYGDYTMNGVGNYDTNFSDNIEGNQRIPTRPTPDYFLGLRSAWELDVWGKLRNQRKASYARLLASEQGTHLIRTTLVAEVARLYYQLLALDSELAIIRQNITLQQKAVELTRVQQSVGRVTQLAVQQLSAQLLNTRSLELEAHQQIIALENGLNQLLGRYPQPIERGKALREQVLPASLAVGVPAGLLTRRPDIRQAELELEAAQLDVAAARASFLPSLTLSSYVGFNAFRASVLFDPASLALGVLGGLSAPLLGQKRLRASYALSVAGRQEAYYNYQKTILTGVSEVVTGLKSIETYGQLAQLKGQEAAELRLAVATSDELFANGYASYLEVVTAQRGVLEAELALVANQKAQWLATIDLYRALGGGW